MRTHPTRIVECHPLRHRQPLPGSGLDAYPPGSGSLSPVTTTRSGSQPGITGPYIVRRRTVSSGCLCIAWFVSAIALAYPGTQRSGCHSQRQIAEAIYARDSLRYISVSLVESPPARTRPPPSRGTDPVPRRPPPGAGRAVRRRYRCGGQDSAEGPEHMPAQDHEARPHRAPGRTGQLPVLALRHPLAAGDRPCRYHCRAPAVR
jgi:hypothetical protein